MSSPEKLPVAAGGLLISKLIISTALLLALLLLALTVDDSSQPTPNDFLPHLSVAEPNHNLTLGTLKAAAFAPKPAPIPRFLNWVSAALPGNFTSTLLYQWRRLPTGGAADLCRYSQTAAISVPSLDGSPGPVQLAAGEAHSFVISALDEFARPRCAGGDYFETDLSGESWKSRPPIADHGNGSYSFKLQVHQDFAGDYNLTIVLLFRSFEGLKFVPERFKYRREMRRIPVRFYKGSASLPELRLCRSSDFAREVWSGRWTRHGKNDQCSIDNDGRYRCLDPNFRCSIPWCEGPLGSLESNGWVYSSHCSFRIFTEDSAWKCLNKKWLFFWGDSNHVDTIRNLLLFVLGVADTSLVSRRFDALFVNPKNRSESVRITNVFNGHWNETQNYLGLESLQKEEFRILLWKYFTEEKSPDVMILNSGLHDGVHWKSLRAFVEAADYAAEFWGEVWKHFRRKNTNDETVPRVFYRTTIATGGYARDLAFNPSKMEAYNGVLVEKLRQKGLLVSGGVIDEFDMTFPWHFDNRCSDGVHYGRAPAKARWRDGEIGHQYFVDLMLVHVILNAICDR